MNKEKAMRQTNGKTDKKQGQIFQENMWIETNHMSHNSLIRHK